MLLLTMLLCFYAGMLRGQNKLYVKPVPAGSGDGSSWANASADLQAVVSNASPGDSIFVAAGTYQPPASQYFSMKDGVKLYGGFTGTETQLSQRDWVTNVTILQGNGNTVIRNYNNGLSNQAVLDGFTVTGGDGADGGGMLNVLCSPTISNCTFSNNAAVRGGGICNMSTASVITNCKFTGNNALKDVFFSLNGGGGMYAVGSQNGVSPSLVDCSFENNTAWLGGGFHNDRSSPVFTNCNFSGNSAFEYASYVESGQGGGFYNNRPSSVASSPSFFGCTFLNNNAMRNGGGIHNNEGTPAAIERCTFSGNNAIYGGGIFTYYGSVFVFKSVFSGNMASSTGAGIFTRNCQTITVTNSIFSGNASLQAAAVHVDQFSRINLLNCTITGNKPQTSPAPRMVVDIYSQQMSLVTNCIIAGNEGHDLAASMNSVVEFCLVGGSGYPGPGNISGEPLFLNAPPAASAPFTGGDYRLLPCSPAINAGSTWFTPSYLTTDMQSNPRILGAEADIGAYEFHTTPDAENILYVNKNVAGGNQSGNSWSNAMTDLAHAIRYADQNKINWTSSNPLKIYVAKGVYKPSYRTENFCTISLSDRHNTFLMLDNVKLYGGFDPANGIDDLSDNRIFGASGSILSGDIGVPNNNTDNSLHVVIFSGPSSNALLDGFTITGGNANASNDNGTANGNPINRTRGGGIYHYAASPNYKNCIITGNNATNWGGGIYAESTSDFKLDSSTVSANTSMTGAGIFNNFSSPVIDACSFSNNNGHFGGAMYNTGSTCNPVISNSQFQANEVFSYGGAVYNAGGTGSFVNCIFSGNKTINGTGGGGAMFNNGAAPVVTNCAFTTNEGDYGGAVYNYAASSPAISGCTFSSNTSGMFGGAMYSEQAATPTLTRCLFTQNSTQFGGAIFSYGSTSLTSCIFSGNWAASYGGAVYNLTSSFTYTNCAFHGNFIVNSTGGGGAVFNNGASIVITNCTFAANTADFGGAIHNYGTGFSAVRNSVVWSINSVIHNESSAGASVEYSIVQGGYPGVGNQNTTPNFMNPFSPAGMDGTWGTGDDGLRLQACSPAVNAGNNALIGAGITTDLIGIPRTQFSTIDIGAYETNSIANSNAFNIVNANAVVNAWQTQTGPTYYGTDCNTLLATITGDGSATSVNGNTTVKVWFESIQPAAYVKRHFEITPPNAAATARITLYFTQAEFDAFNAINIKKLPQNPGDAAGKANLLVEKRGGSSNNNTGLPTSYPGPVQIIDPNDADIVWDVFTARWEVSFAVTGFSGFFVRTSMTTLPLTLKSFSAQEKNCVATLKWTTTGEVNVSHFEVEQSTDGVSFVTARSVPAENNMAENNYTATVAVLNDKMFYRLKMVDIDGRKIYSQTVLILSICGNKISAYPNPAKDKLYVKNASLHSNYVLYDNTGKKVTSGRIISNVQEIVLAGLASGIYYITVIEKDGSSSQLRFVKD